MRMCVRVLWPVALCGAIGLAQPLPDAGSKSIPLSKVERKNEAPVSKDILRVQLPKPVEFKLDDGLTVLVLENHRLPTVTLRLLIQGRARSTIRRICRVSPI